jgi:predicted nuclease of restriction endonuclease-like RecB superfamily
VLTADLVKLRRRGDIAYLPKVRGPREALTLAIAAGILAVFEHGLGRPRGELVAEAELVVAHDALLRRGLLKLVLDAASFEHMPTIDFPARRAAVFAEAALQRRAGSFERTALLGRLVADAPHSTLGILDERALLYGDLPELSKLRHFPVGEMTPGALLSLYELALEQAALLRSEEVRVTLRGVGPLGMRAIFRKLKFLGLLFTVNTEHELVVDGPMNLFSGGTKYGFALAMLLPTLRAAGSYQLQARIRMRDRSTATLHLESTCRGTALEDAVTDEVRTLLRALKASQKSQSTPWRFAVAGAFVELPGGQVWLPDLTATRAHKTVYIEYFSKHQGPSAELRAAALEKLWSPKEDAFFLLCAPAKKSAKAVLKNGAFCRYRRVVSYAEVLEQLENFNVIGNVPTPLQP